MTDKTTEGNDNTQDAFDALLTALIPTLNKELSKLIESNGLDPWEEVLSGDYTLGKINLGICKAKVKASYSVKNMKGLSSLLITTAVVDKIDLQDPNNISGSLTLNAELSQDLSAKVGGKVKASCGGISEKVGIDGSVTAKGVVGKASAKFTGSMGSSVCLNTVSIDSFKLDYDKISVKIDGLGIFNEFLDPLVDLIDDLFGQAIKGEIADALKPVLNDLMKDELPYCYKLT